MDLIKRLKEQLKKLTKFDRHLVTVRTNTFALVQSIKIVIHKAIIADTGEFPGLCTANDYKNDWDLSVTQVKLNSSTEEVLLHLPLLH